MKIRSRELAFACAVHQVVEGRDVLLKIDLAGVLDIGDHQHACAIFAFHVDRDPQVDLRPNQAERLAASLRVRVIQARIGLQRFYDRPPDQMGIGNLALPD